MYPEPRSLKKSIICKRYDRGKKHEDGEKERH